MGKKALCHTSSAITIGLILAYGVLFAAPCGEIDDEQDITTVHGLAMHGDLKYLPDFKNFDYVNPQAPKGGRVRLKASGDSYDSFNQFILKGRAAAGIGRVYDTLMVQAADEPFSMYGLLAESVTLPADRTWIEFKLRDARWHDGEPVGVDDVIWSFETLTSKGLPFFASYYKDVLKAEAAGDNRVRFTFRDGVNRELPLILGQLIVLPKHYWAERDFTKTTLEPPLGSGPYKVRSFKPGRFVEYERVEDYWGRDLPVNVGQTNFRRIRYEYFRDDTVAIQAFKKNAFDFRVENSSKHWALAYDFWAVKQGLVKKEEVRHNRVAGMQGFVFNTRRQVFRDRRVREALAYAYDFDQSNRQLFYGQYTRSHSYFGNSVLAATGLPGPEERAILEPYRDELPEEVFTKAYEPPSTTGPGGVRANILKAERLLQEAGWVVDDATGKLTHQASGQRMQFEILVISNSFARVAEPFKQSLAELGVKATIHVALSGAEYQRRVDAFDFDMVIRSFAQTLSPGNEQRNFWGSEFAERPGSRNLAGINDPVVDALIEGVINASDRAALVHQVRALDRVLQWGFWVVPQFHIKHDRLIYWDRFGQPDITPTRGVQFDTWWIDPDKSSAIDARRRR